MPEIARGSLAAVQYEISYQDNCNRTSFASETTLDGEFTTRRTLLLKIRTRCLKGNFYDAKVVDGEFVNTAFARRQKTLAKHGR